MPRPLRACRDHSVSTLVVAGMAAAAVIASSATALAGARIPIATGGVLCPFRLITGLPCPACGLTRSWVALMQGDFSASVGYHPLGWAVLLLAMLVVGGTALRLLRRTPVPPLNQLVRPPLFWLVTGSVIVFGWVRLFSLVD